MIFRSGVNLNQTFTTTPDGLSLKEYPELISRDSSTSLVSRI